LLHRAKANVKALTLPRFTDWLAQRGKALKHPGLSRYRACVMNLILIVLLLLILLGGGGGYYYGGPVYGGGIGGLLLVVLLVWLFFGRRP
jgi:hypothetical protein